MFKKLKFVITGEIILKNDELDIVTEKFGQANIETNQQYWEIRAINLKKKQFIKNKKKTNSIDPRMLNVCTIS